LYLTGPTSKDREEVEGGKGKGRKRGREGEKRGK